MPRTSTLLVLATLLVLLGNCDAIADAPSVVSVNATDGRFQLIRNGKPYAIHGAGGSSYLAELASAGGNSIRTWSADGLGVLLDQAQEHGLTVCVGMWLGHERHGFDYQDESAVVKQLEKCVGTVRKFKDHPAVLLWGIGNEMEGDGRNPAVWHAINQIAGQIKRIDPDHPTMTVIAELGENEHKLRSIERFCPDIDIIGVNAYGGIRTLADRYRKAGVSKPYVVTEHGPPGPWEVGKTNWGSPIEPTSTVKAEHYADGYRRAVAEQRGLCLGSYAFLWGHKQETTATWFGMLLPDGSRLAAVDAMTEAWTGSPPRDRCPVIESLELDRTDKLKPGERITAELVTRDPENQPLEISWVLLQDSGTLGVGGDYQPEENRSVGSVAGNGTRAVVTVPRRAGAYRLFAYVRDGQGGAAVANVPIDVDAPDKPLPNRKSKADL